MRILQLIDSLNPGGAEKMAVNYANAWAKDSVKSFLISTNKGGALQNQISKDVVFVAFNRSKQNAIFVFIKILFFINRHQINIVHAHGSSYKWSKYLKYFFPKIKFYWHDHNGNRLQVSSQVNNSIIALSKYFDGAIGCNEELTSWAKENLYTKRCFYIPNFTIINRLPSITTLNGMQNKRIVCVANWRNPKNHLLLVQAFYHSKIADYGWSLHLVGKNYQDAYSEKLLEFIDDNNVKNIFTYGVCTDIGNILNQAQVGVLISTHEGFPISLLEYGLAGLFPIVSNVGHMPKLVANMESGFVLYNNDLSEMIELFNKLQTNEDWKVYARNFSELVHSDFAPESILKKFKDYIYV